MKTKKQIQQELNKEQLKCCKEAYDKKKDNWNPKHFKYCEADLKIAQLEMIEDFEKEIVGFLGKLQSEFNIQGETISWETDVDNWEEIKEELKQLHSSTSLLQLPQQICSGLQSL